MTERRWSRRRFLTLSAALLSALRARSSYAQRLPPEDDPRALPRPTPRPRPPLRVRVPILMYHYISAPPTPNDRLRYNLSVPPAEFELHLDMLQRLGYTTISLYDLYAHLKDGAPLPPKPVVLTFDDGYLDAYTEAFPRLKARKMTGTFFIVTDFINFRNPNHLTWAMAREMAEAGMSIEPHSRTHPDLRNRSHNFLVWEILGPIEQITYYAYGERRRPRFFCYPSGQYDDHVIRFLKTVDIWAAVTTQPGLVHTLQNAYTWSRQRVLPGMNAKQFARLLGESV